ncbi:hypothetical protein C3L23_09395 [Nautilia sp. PV-1]|uniref:DUF3343 domain-containing protein n=1 Tax=Nautilia sp. PV-1 TaxID=2579250 RepID=UPI000FD9592A|nr:DUF3343 domain-containing protein [Nautilia sp. PV-1]AZV47470.1 hypothetical protein C3L23_09395 [Nautilia sp. PV-1]
MAELKYLPAGVRLHFKELVYKLTDDLNRYYYFHFEDIPTGLKAEKLLKDYNIKSIPTPDEIFEDCGVSILTTDKETIKDVLLKEGINFEIWKYENGFKKIEGEIVPNEKGTCKI